MTPEPDELPETVCPTCGVLKLPECAACGRPATHPDPRPEVRDESGPRRFCHVCYSYEDDLKEAQSRVLELEAARERVMRVVESAITYQAEHHACCDCSFGTPTHKVKLHAPDCVLVAEGFINRIGERSGGG